MDARLKADAIKRLQEDWVAENSDAREEDVTKWQLTNQIQKAKKRSLEDPSDPERMLSLAEAYAVLDPRDHRCLNVCERMIESGSVNALDTQLQGDAYQLQGRSLFLAGKFEESLRALLRAQICYKEKGNKKLRRQNNTGLLRAYSVLGRSKEAAQRLEVALTLVDVADEGIMLYMHAKGALEHTDVARDAEVLDDIWYVYMEEHPEHKQKFEEYQAMGTNVTRQCAGNEDGEDPDLTWDEIWRRLCSREMWEAVLPEVINEVTTNKFFRALLVAFVWLLMLYVSLNLKPLFKNR